MIIFIKADGTIITSDVSRVYQGQNVANSITIVAPYPKTNAASIGFTLSNGVRTTNYALTPIDAIDDVVDKLGNEYSYWQWQTKNGAITALAGAVLGQFFITENGETIATGSFTFDVEQGVMPVLPDTPTPDTWQDLLTLYNNLAGKLTNKLLEDFTVNAETGIGTKYYNDGSTATVQFPTGGGGTVFESAAVTVLTFTTDSFIQDGDTYSIAFSPLQTGFDDNEFITNLAEATTVNDTTGYVQRADAFFLGSDGSILLDGIATPFNGRLILLGKAVLEGQLVSGVSLLGTALQISFIGGATQTVSLVGLFNKQSITIPANAWVDKSTTVSVSGVTADSLVFVSYAESSYQLWKDAGIRCTAQGNGTLTFTCEYDAPTQDVTANIAFWG